MRILLGMSGGLDSTYAALKLMELGHSVEGAVLLMHEHTELEAARSAADSVGIRLHIVDCRKEFEKIVVENFINEYLKARTPNPCTICNSEVKFKYLLEFAKREGFDMIATGHYAKIVCVKTENGKRFAIEKGKDAKKDQSYMLWRLSQDILSHLHFPLGDDEKSDVKAEAKYRGLVVAERPESQEICFIPSGDYADFIEKRTYPSPHGKFVDTDGNVLGEHNGIIRYTVGQRKGLGISYGKRIFVTKITPEDNTVTLSPCDSYKTEFTVSDMIFSGIEEMREGEELSLFVKIRYAATPTSATLKYLGGGRGAVKLDVSQRAVTPGQSAVFYRENVLLCGGYID